MRTLVYWLCNWPTAYTNICIPFIINDVYEIYNELFMHIDTHIILMTHATGAYNFVKI